MMKTVLILLLAVISSALSMDSYGQNILQDTIRWKAAGFNDLVSRSDFNAACYFVTYRSEIIEWVQDNGKVVYKMPIKNVDGRWEDIRTDGKINYSFELERMAGNMTIQRLKGQIRLVIEFPEWSGGPFRGRYHITNVEMIRP